jgi:SAM-dependent methyltransferase
VVLADINASDARVGRDKLIDTGTPGSHVICAGGRAAPAISRRHFDCITIAFGLRNVTDKDRALRSMLRILKPGGRLLVLEFSKPRNPLLSRAYDAYSFGVLPLMGRLVAGDSESYQYLAESIRMHPDQETLREMMEDAGFLPARVPQYDRRRRGRASRHQGLTCDSSISPTLKTAGLAALEQALNRALALAPAGQAELSQLAGQVFALHCTAPALDVYLQPTDELRLRGVYDGETTTSLRGERLRFRRTGACSEDPAATLDQRRVGARGEQQRR